MRPTGPGAAQPPNHYPRRPATKAATRGQTMERVRTIAGIEGLLFVGTPETTGRSAGLHRHQRWVTTKVIQYYGREATIKAELRFDDNCGNGHQTFSMTGDVRYPRARDIETGGCIHELLAEHFPALAPLAAWHLFDTRGPMHYPGNALFLAGERDCWGKLKGEPKQWSTFVLFGDSPIGHKCKAPFVDFIRGRLPDGGPWEVVAVPHKDEPNTRYKFADKYTFDGYPCEWYQCPFDTLQEAQEWAAALRGKVTFESRPTAWGEGKARELDLARSSACWPEATDEQLSLPTDDLRKLLVDRLPGLLAQFRAAMVDVCGFEWREPAPVAEAVE